MKNKKGFTLVELLAVIVILALIMGIAVVSIGGVLTSSREKTYRETAASLIDGVRKQLYVDNKVEAGTYTFTSSVLEKGGANSPFGGTYQYVSGCDESNYAGTEVVSGICKLTGSAPACGVSTKAYVVITESSGAYSYAICLADGSRYVDTDATENSLLDNSATIKTAS